MSNDRDSILIVPNFQVTKAMCISNYFTSDMQVMNNIAIKQEVSDMRDEVFGDKCFYLQPVWCKIHDLKINKGNNFYKFDVTSVFPTCILYFCLFYLEKKLGKSLKIIFLKRLRNAVIWYVLYITFTRIACL